MVYFSLYISTFRINSLGRRFSGIVWQPDTSSMKILWKLSLKLSISYVEMRRCSDDSNILLKKWSLRINLVIFLFTPLWGGCQQKMSSVSLWICWNLLFKKKCKVGDLSCGWPKGSIATTRRCWGGHYSFPWIAPLYPWSHLIMLSVKQGGIKYQFLSLSYDLTWDWTLVSRSIGEHYSFDQSQLENAEWMQELMFLTDIINHLQT